jgi:hypothetical protein
MAPAAKARIGTVRPAVITDPTPESPLTMSSPIPEILLLAPDIADSMSLRKPDELPFRLITAEPITEPDSANF